MTKTTNPQCLRAPNVRPWACRIAKVAKEKIDELDIQAVVRPGGHHGHSGSQDASRRDDVPEHYYQCAARCEVRALQAQHQPHMSGSVE